MHILEAHNIYKLFGTHAALTDVTIRVPRGSVYGLLGPNGAGKTTLLRIINQILGPDKGEVLFNGQQLHQNHVSEIGYLPEERGLYKKMKVGEQALYLARLKGMSRIEALKKLKYWFEKFEIEAWWDKRVEELSKGMAQKVQFITTILHEPKLLIFDEPFSGFDPINANLLKNEILELKHKGATIIFSTHNMASVEELCDNITLINKSNVLLQGSVDEVRSRYSTGSFEVSFVGNPDIFSKIIEGRFQLVEIKNTGNVHTAIVKVNTALSDNELLSLLIPNVHVVSYKELLPGMNEIFINVVNKQA
jgi:ABC-2 type transport system ATP-binding protein